MCVSFFLVFVCLVLLLPFDWGFICLFVCLFIIVAVDDCLFLSLLFALGYVCMFVLFLPFLFSFLFFPFLSNCVASGVLVPRPGIGPELMRWECQVQDA